MGELCTCMTSSSSDEEEEDAAAEDEMCQDCVVSPWKSVITKHLQGFKRGYFAKHPKAEPRYVTAMLRTIQREVEDVLWKAYCYEGGDQICTSFVHKTLFDVHAAVIERRQQLIAKCIAKPVERTIFQHFQPLLRGTVDIPHPYHLIVHSQTHQCLYCTRGQHRKRFNLPDAPASDDEEDAKWRGFPWKPEVWGTYPPEELRDFLIEQCLHIIDEEKVSDLGATQRACDHSLYKIHCWFHAQPTSTTV